jgi:site-specific recombinase XerC
VVAEVLKAGANAQAAAGAGLTTRGGLSAVIVKQLCSLGLGAATVPRVVRDCALVVLCFCVGLRESSARQLKPDDVSVTEGGLPVRVVHRKRKSAARPLWVSYKSIAAHDSQSPLELVQRWLPLAEPGAGFWSNAQGVARWRRKT